MTDKFLRKFSIPHNDALTANQINAQSAFPPIMNGTYDDAEYYNLVKNAAPEWREEIDDIYFGYPYYYELDGITRRYGDVMGVEASGGQLDYLFKIQDEFNIGISLTLNQEIHPVEIVMNEEIRNGFIEHIRKLYDRGLRTVTVGNIHLMSSGFLQEAFPEMMWKNTVNHNCATPQEMQNMYALGYTKILLDRSLNRNIAMLRKMSRLAKELGITTTLLVSESCISSCPFKREHDQIQPWIGGPKGNYWSTLGNLSCNAWKFKHRKWNSGSNNANASIFPRNGINCVWDKNPIYDKYHDLVDVFKYSGRLSYMSGDTPENAGFSWVYTAIDGTKIPAKCFADIYDTEVGFLSEWSALGQAQTDIVDPFLLITSDGKINQDVIDTFNNFEHPWKSDVGQKMVKALVNCKSECWDCHLCEATLDFKPIDSLISLGRTVSGYEYVDDDINNT